MGAKRVGLFGGHSFVLLKAVEGNLKLGALPGDIKRSAVEGDGLSQRVTA